MVVGLSGPDVYPLPGVNMLKLAIAAGLGALVLSAPSLTAQDSTNLSDANVVAIFIKANQKDVDTGKLAVEKSANKDVKEMGKMFATAHAGLKDQVEELAKKQKINPVLPAENKGDQEHDKVLSDLKAKSGADFDKAWLAHEIEYHQFVIDYVTKTLLPSTKNPELKAFLEKAAPAFQGHLVAAQNLQKKLGYTT
jgi:putative membrane protein